MDTNKLKELAEEVIRIEQNEDEPISTAWALFDSAANPQAILGLIAEVERLRRLEVRQKEIADHYKKWFKEIVYESFDEWLKDDATHWIGEQDAALHAWQYLHENKIWLMKERIEEHEQERDRLKAENAALRKDAERYRHLRNTSMIAAGRVGKHSISIPHYDMSEADRLELDAFLDAALEGGGR